MPSYPFTIYDGRVMQNRNSLENDTAREVWDFFSWFFSGREMFSDLITKVEVWSQNRNDGGSHGQHKAIDIAVHPLWLNPYIFTKIHRHKEFNIYISAHNAHIHIDSWYRNNTDYQNNTHFWKNMKRVEVKWVLPNGTVPIITVPAHENFFTSLPQGYFNEYNKALCDRYDFSDLRDALNSATRFVRLSTTRRGQSLLVAYNTFSDIITQKEPMRQRGVIDDILDPRGNPPERDEQIRREEFDWKPVVYGAAIFATLLLLKDTSPKTYIVQGKP